MEFTPKTNGIEKELASKTETIVVSALPSSSAEYDFSDGVSKFVNYYRTACTAETDADNGGYYQKITNSGNSNTYRSATFDCTDIMANATSMTVQFDALFSGRWHFSIADLSQRPGESTGPNYTTAGCAFTMGTSNGTNIAITGASGTVTLSDWRHVKAVLDFTAKTAEYTVTDRATGTVLKTGTVSFPDTTVTGVTGFEAYTWSSSDLLIDNIKITARTGVKENARYLVANGDGYEEYQYIDGEAVKLNEIEDGSITADKLSFTTYSTTPVQVGTWINGTPVWRAAIACALSSLGIEANTDASITYREMLEKLGMVGSGDTLILSHNLYYYSNAGADQDADAVEFGDNVTEDWYHVTFSGSSSGDYAEWILGYIEFVTSESNIKTTTAA